MKRLITLIMSLVFIASSIPVLMSASAENLTLVYNYSGLVNALVNNSGAAVYKHNVEHEGRKTLHLTPNDIQKPITLDSWDLASKGFDISKYGYLVVSYKYETQGAAYDGPMKISFMSSGILKKGVTLNSNEGVVANEWATATFCFKDLVKDNFVDESKTILKQMHFSPFGNTNADRFKNLDELYIESVTLMSENPNPDFEYKISFEKGEEKASGEEMQELLVKAGEELTLPNCTYSLEGAKFKGWMWSLDGKLYPAGHKFTYPEAATSFIAKWEYEKAIAESIVLSYPSYYQGTVNGHDRAIVSKTEMDATSCVKVAANPSAEKEGEMALDCWEYARAKVDLSLYKYLQITYKYVSDAPKSDIMMKYNIMASGVMNSAFSATSQAPLVSGEWATANFDLSGVKGLLKPDLAEHIFKQAHLYPFGSTKNTALSENDVIYISQLGFFVENPGSESHNAFMNGYSDGSFKPNNTMSRAEACTIVARLLASESEISKNDTSSFSDVKNDAWYFKYVAHLEKLGYLKAYSGEFMPNKPITRAEFVELVFNMGLIKATDKKVEFTDVPQSHERYNVIMAASSSGIVNGYEDNTFLPDRTITRAQVVRVINNANGRHIDANTPATKLPEVFTDVDASFWAYYDIMEATIPHTYKIVDEKEKWNSIISLEIKNFDKGEAYIKSLDEITKDRIAEIRATKDTVVPDENTFYVSAEGNDENDGKTPETAWKTLSKAATAAKTAGNKILFRRGDLFRGTLNTYANVTIAAYGEGAKPIITTSPENAAYEEAWIKTDVENIYKYHKAITVDVGAIVCNEGENVGIKVIVDKNGIDRTTGKPFSTYKELPDNYFYHDVKDDFVYFRCDKGNPGVVYDSIELSVGSHCIRVNSSGANIDNICVMYAGAHGVSGPTASNLIVTNCEFGYIGGSRQGDKTSSTRYGNAVEIYGGCENYQVKNCYIYQVYDAGVTHQVNGGTTNLLMKDIVYSDNVIEYCTYNIEYFLGGDTESTADRRMQNVLIKNNILRNAGFGWGYQRPDRGSDASIKGWSSYNKADNFVIENNIIDRARCVLIHIGANYEQWLPSFVNNTYVQFTPARFIQYGQNPVKEYAFNGKVNEVIENVLKEKDYTVHFVKAK